MVTSPCTHTTTTHHHTRPAPTPPCPAPKPRPIPLNRTTPQQPSDNRPQNAIHVSRTCAMRAFETSHCGNVCGGARRPHTDSRRRAGPRQILCRPPAPFILNSFLLCIKKQNAKTIKIRPTPAPNWISIQIGKSNMEKDLPAPAPAASNWGALCAPKAAAARPRTAAAAVAALAAAAEARQLLQPRPQAAQRQLLQLRPLLQQLLRPRLLPGLRQESGWWLVGAKGREEGGKCQNVGDDIWVEAISGPCAPPAPAPASQAAPAPASPGGCCAGPIVLPLAPPLPSQERRRRGEGRGMMALGVVVGAVEG